MCVDHPAAMVNFCPRCLNVFSSHGTLRRHVRHGVCEVPPPAEEDESVDDSDNGSDDDSGSISDDSSDGSVNSSPDLLDRDDSTNGSESSSDGSEESESIASDDSRYVHHREENSRSSSDSEVTPPINEHSRVNPNELRTHSLPPSDPLYEVDDILYPASVSHFDTAVENVDDIVSVNLDGSNSNDIDEMFGDVIENIDILNVDDEISPGYGNHDDYSNTRMSGHEDDGTVMNQLSLLKIQPAEVHLLYYMMIYAIPAVGYKPLMHWAHHAQLAGFDFKNAVTHKTITKRIEKHATGPHARVIETPVTHGGLGTAQVYHFDFISNLAKLLRDPLLMSDALFRYDHKSDYYGEQNTGTWWRRADRFMKRRLKAFKIPVREWKMHIIVPIILFIDATHCDRNGRLKAEPILMTIGNIPVEIRKTVSAWCMLGLLPSKLITPEESKLHKQGTGRRCAELELYHDCIMTILQTIFDLQEADRRSGDGYTMFVYGQGNMHCHLEMSIYVGDTAGHDPFTCHYKAYSTPTARPCRSCDVTFDDLDNHKNNCTAIEMAYIRDKIELYITKIDKGKKVGKYRAKAALLSQHLISPFVYSLSHGGDRTGVFGATPFEVLHAHLLGLLKRGLGHIYDWKIPNTAGAGYSKMFNKSQFDKRVRILSDQYQRKSD